MLGTWQAQTFTQHPFNAFWWVIIYIRVEWVKRSKAHCSDRCLWTRLCHKNMIPPNQDFKLCPRWWLLDPIHVDLSKALWPPTPSRLIAFWFIPLRLAIADFLSQTYPVHRVLPSQANDRQSFLDSIHLCLLFCLPFYLWSGLTVFSILLPSVSMMFTTIISWCRGCKWSLSWLTLYTILLRSLSFVYKIHNILWKCQGSGLDNDTVYTEKAQWHYRIRLALD